MNDQQLEDLGARARHAQDAILASRPLPPLVLERPSTGLRHLRPLRLLAVAGAVSAVVLGLGVTRPQQPSAPAVAVAVAPSSPSSPSSPSLPAWVSPDVGARVAAIDPTWVTLSAGGVSLQGTAPDAAGRPPVLEVGAWQVRPQPGARVTVRWDPAQLALSIEVREGDAQVRGAGVDGVRVLRAGEQLSSSPLVSPVPVARPSSSAGASTPVALAAPPPASTSDQADASAPPTPPVTTTWQELARAHRYTDALMAVRHDGVDRVLAEASADDLLLLGDSARFSLDVALASSSFMAVRARFAGSTQAARAGFHLARIASDTHHDHAQAAVLLREYLDVAPDDVLSQEAAGRLVEVLDHSGQQAQARDAATVYLRRWPTGPHAELCRSTLASSAASSSASTSTGATR